MSAARTLALYRLPLQPLLDKLDARLGPDALPAEQAREIGLSTRSWNLWRHLGTVPAVDTDDIAGRLGCLPFELWGRDWETWADAWSVRFEPEAKELADALA
jgi:hypothetical protein